MAGYRGVFVVGGPAYRTTAGRARG